MNRRQYLSRTAKYASRAGLVLGGTMSIAAAATPVYDHQPNHVTLVYDEDALLSYRPRFVLSHLEVSVTDVYAWIARSPEYDTNMYCYWVFYAGGQEGVSDADSHVPDREPVYVEVDSDTGQVETVHKDVYHYLNEATPATAQPMDGLHPKLRIIKPWHPYEPTTTAGVLLDVADMHTVYETWRDLDEWTVHEPAVVNPWSLPPRGHWWPDGSYGVTAKDEYWRFIYDTFGRIDLGRDT